MVTSFSGSMITTPAVSGIGADWPKQGKVSYTGFFNETTYKWTVRWSASATGGTRASAWTQSYYGEVIFYKGSTAISSGSYDTTIQAYNDATLLTGEFEVEPNADGTLELTVSAYFRFYWNSAAGETSKTEVISCPTADIGSKLALYDSSGNPLSSIRIYPTVESYTFKATITVKGSRYHILKYGIDPSSAVTVSGVDLIDTTADVSFTYEDILLHFPNATGNIFFYLDTYTDSAHTNKYGPTNIVPLAVTIHLHNVYYKPTITGGYIVPDDDNNPFKNLQSDPQLLIAGITESIFKYTSITPGKGAKLKSVTYEITYGSISTVTGEIPLSELGTYKMGVCPEHVDETNKKYEASFKITVTDSRGAVRTTTITKDVYDYRIPQVTVNIYRVEDQYDTTMNDSGEWVYINFQATQPFDLELVSGSTPYNPLESVYCVSEGSIEDTWILTPTQSPVQVPDWVQLTRNESATFVVRALDAIGQYFQSRGTKDLAGTATIVVHRAIYPLILHDDLSGNELGKGIEINGFANHINPSGTPTMYHFEMGSEEMDIGIHSDGKKGFTDGTNWLQYHDGTAHHLFGLFGNNYTDDKTISATDVQYRTGTVSGNGIVIASVTLWKQVYNNAGDLIALIQAQPSGGGWMNVSRQHFFSDDTNNHAISVSASLYMQDGDKLYLGVWGTMGGDKVVTTNVTCIGCDITLDSTYHTI